MKIAHVFGAAALRWSGEAIWVPLGDLDLGLTYENPTSYPAPGQIIVHPGGISETEILLAYGSVHFGRRKILWLGATTHPSAEWMSRQLTEACGWEQGPRYLVRDRDSIYGEVFIWQSLQKQRPLFPKCPAMTPSLD